MNAASFSPFSRYEPPPLPATPAGATEGAAPPSGQRPSQRSSASWRRMLRWIQENTFVPAWLPKPLRHPLIGYLIAGLIEGLAASVILLVLIPFPMFTFRGILTLVGVVLVALGWGAGPGLFASLMGTVVLYLLVLGPYSPSILRDPVNSIGLLSYLAIGASISLLAGQNERARRQAKEMARSMAKAEARSRLEAEHLRTVLEVLPSAVMITNREGQIQTVNQATRTLWGGAVPLGADIMRSPRVKVWWSQSGQPLAPDEWTVDRALTSGQAVLNDELELETRDRQRKAILCSAAPIRDEAGAMTGAVISAQDISELRRLEREVAERAQELEAVFEAMTDGVFVYDAQERITHVNGAGRATLGIDALPDDRPLRERAALRPPLDGEGQSIPFERLPAVRMLHGEALTGAQAVDMYFPTPQGDMQVFNASGTPLRSADGSVTGGVLVTRDVTERHRLEREVAERAQELEAILDTITDGVALLNTHGQLVRTNPAFRHLLGFDQHREYLTLPYEQRQAAFTIRNGEGQPVPLAAPQGTAPLHGKAFTGVDLIIENLDGREVVVNVDGAPLRDQRGKVTGYLEVYRDVAARRHLEQRTRETLGALVAMAEAMVQTRPATLIADSDGGAEMAPLADATLPVVARRLAELTRALLECRRVSIVAVDAATGRLSPVTEVGLSTEQEQAWWASWSPAPLLEERYGTAVAAAVRAGESAALDPSRLLERSWRALFGAQSGHIMPMRLGEELVGVLLVDYLEPGNDASADERLFLMTLARLGALVLERNRLLRGWAEARANELALAETQAQMDTFLGIASHELKTPLTSLKLSLEVTERRLRKLAVGKGASETRGETRGETRELAAGRDAQLHGAMEQLSRAARQMGRMERLINDLLDVSRIQADKLELRLDQVDLVAIVREVVEAQREAAPERSIQLQCPVDQAVLVSADGGRIEQVVTNYVTNALKYSPADRPVEVGVEAGPRQARVWVRDQGPGLPLSEQERIWERFHRVKGVEVQSGSGVGLGLGLHISRIMVERHQGQVGVESIPGNGSTFWFTLPLPHPEEKGR